MGPTRRSLKNPAVRALRTDDDLVQAAQSGDHEAFTELCRRHAQVARHKILAIVRHREDAEDALQETMLSAYANLGEFRQSAKFSTWITAIGINAALTVIRKRKSRREFDLESNNPEDSAWDFPDQAPDPESHVAATSKAKIGYASDVLFCFVFRSLLFVTRGMTLRFHLPVRCRSLSNDTHPTQKYTQCRT